MTRANKKVASGSHWNLNKLGSWELFKVGMEEAAKKIYVIIDDK
jgi:hypothetical protein